MKNIYIVSENGQYQSSFSGDDSLIEFNVKDINDNLKINVAPTNHNDYWDFNLKKWVSIGESPSEYHIFNYETKQWQDFRSLEDVKYQKWQEIKSQREFTETAGVVFNHYIYDSDMISQQRLTTAISLNKDIAWKTKDNQLTILTPRELKSLQKTIAQHISDVYHHAEYLRERIMSANHIEDIDNIQWSYTQSQAI